MTRINKQNFLNELGGLLTFMSEEDRLEALTLYEKMFDDTDDEQTLIQALRSPTRQAVVIARAYDANARKMRAHAQSGRQRGEEQEPTPDFVLAILQVYEEAVPLPQAVAAPRIEPAAEPVVEEEAPEVLPDQVSLFEERPVEMAEVVLVEDEAESEERRSAADAPSGLELEASAPFERENAALLESLDGQSRVLPEDQPEDDEALRWVGIDEDDEDDDEREMVRRTKVPLLILFVLCAVPLTLLGVALLLIPAALSLALAAGTIAAGGAGIAAAFGGFAMFADILVVLGGSIIALALGVLFLWLFVWFIGGAIAGLIRAVIQLGRAWCYEEVPA